MKLIIENANEELAILLRNQGLTVSAFGDDEELIKTIEKTVETVVEVEKPLPEYAKLILDAVNGAIENAKEATMAEYAVYKTRCENIVELLNSVKTAGVVKDEE